MLSRNDAVENSLTADRPGLARPCPIVLVLVLVLVIVTRKIEHEDEHEDEQIRRV
jgi:hypothetical protein